MLILVQTRRSVAANNYFTWLVDSHTAVHLSKRNRNTTVGDHAGITEERGISQRDGSSFACALSFCRESNKLITGATGVL